MLCLNLNYNDFIKVNKKNKYIIVNIKLDESYIGKQIKIYNKHQIQPKNCIIEEIKYISIFNYTKHEDMLCTGGTYTKVNGSVNKNALLKDYYYNNNSKYIKIIKIRKI